jgi:hypothetical protein
MRNDRRPLILTLTGLVLLAAVAQSDLELGSFWSGHAMLTSLIASLVVVALTVAVVNEYLDRRDRRRWRVLAQAVLFDVLQSSRSTWTGLVEVLGLGAVETGSSEGLRAGAHLLDDLDVAGAAITAALGDPLRRGHLRRLTHGLAEEYGETISRWASVMVGASAYALLFDRHVELYGRLDWIASLLAHGEPPPEATYRERRLVRSSIAVQQADEIDDAWIRDNLLATARLARQLDFEAHDEAFRLVPGEWWQARTAELTN